MAESKLMMKMKNPRFESMWKMMEENNLGVDDNIESEYLCIICKNILIDACSAPCGCRYCRTCITDYLRDEMKMCPGDSEYCQNEMINIDCDIHIDQTINTRICRLIVKCPNNGCQTKVDIKSMENHIMMCEKRNVSCPFSNIGCKDSMLKSDKINEHLLSEVLSHTKLLMEWVNISRNETELLKNDVNQLRLNNHDLKEKIEGSEKIIQQLEKNKIENSTQFERLSEEMTEMRHENISLKGQLRNLEIKHDMYQVFNVKMRENLEKKIQEIDEFKRQYRMKEQLLDKQDKSQQKKINDINIKLNEILLCSATMKEKSNETFKSIEDIQESIVKLSFGEFIWKIDGWTEKQQQAKNDINQRIYSKPFLSFKNSYKICLGMYPNGTSSGIGTHLSIFYYIMKGPNDEILQWPFKHDVEISLINQKTGLVNHTETIAYSDKPDFIESFTKPTCEKNNGFGSPQFIKLDEISTTDGLCENDQIVVKCRVKYLPKTPKVKNIV